MLMYILALSLALNLAYVVLRNEVTLKEGRHNITVADYVARRPVAKKLTEAWLGINLGLVLFILFF